MGAVAAVAFEAEEWVGVDEAEVAARLGTGRTLTVNVARVDKWPHLELMAS